jgi:hypothetical protein
MKISDLSREFRYSGKRWFVVGAVVPKVAKKCSDFIFRVTQSKRPFEHEATVCSRKVGKH